MTDFVPLAAVATITSGKRPSVVSKEPSNALRFPVIGGGGPSGYTSEALYTGGVLITGRVGTLGKLFAPTEPCWPSDNALVILPKSERTDRCFLRYALQSRITDAVGLNRGAANPLITQTDLGRLVIYHPEHRRQRAIASTLGALDDKIDLNRRMNETLEAMVRAIFKDWFVDFGPTRAKVEGRPPYLAPDLWALFPDRLDGDDRPEGWELRRIDQLMELGYGKALPADVRIPGDCPVYGSGGISGFHSTALLSPPSVIVGRKGTVGSLFWEDRPCFAIDTVFYVIPRAVPLSFCYYLLGSLGLGEMNTDAAVPGLNRNNVYRLSGPWSDGALARRFDELVLPLRRKLFANDEEGRSLAATRDLLLPKLMSGEIRVREAEKIMAEVA